MGDATIAALDQARPAETSGATSTRTGTAGPAGGLAVGGTAISDQPARLFRIQSALIRS